MNRNIFTILILLVTAIAFADDDIRFRTFLPYGDVLEDGKVLPADHYMGNMNAPIIMIEYASFSCIHCATFSNKVLPLIKSQYIDAGKLLFVFRDFPLDAAALKASTLAQCYASNKYCELGEKRDYFSMYHALFHSLHEWAFASDVTAKLKKVAEVGKMDSKYFVKCLEDKEIQEQILNSKIYAIRNLRINASPVFLINGQKYEGFRDFEFFSKIFNEIIQKSESHSQE